jgi:uncharacterized protein YkwD
MAVEQWINSQGHRDNMLAPEVNYGAVAVECNGDKCYYTQLLVEYSG